MAYFTLMTDAGRSKLAAAAANSQTLNITHMALGDGAGAPVEEPNGYETALVNEVYRAPLNSLTDIGARFVADLVVPANIGNFTVREMGLYDDEGDLIAYANTPEIEKPTAAQGVVVDFRPTITVELEIQNSVTVIVDPAIISASQQWVTTHFLPVTTSYLKPAQNLADLDDASAARVNLGAGQANGLATLDENGKVPEEQIPMQRLAETHVAADEPAMLALSTAQKGDMCIRLDEEKTYALIDNDPSVLANWLAMSRDDAVSSVAGKTGTVTLVKADVGLSNVDNTSDANKPVSTAQQSAIATAKGEAIGGANQYTNQKIAALTKANVGLGNVNNTSDADKPVSTAQQSAIATAKNEVQSNLTAHANSDSAHGATPAAIASKIIRRDASGRAKVAAPSAATDIANKQYVDGVGASAATPNTIIRRDANGRAKVAAPSAATDIATKSYVDNALLVCKTSAEIKIEPRKINQWAHGMGKMPFMWSVVLVCKTANFGYSVGDEVALFTAFDYMGWALTATPYANNNYIGIPTGDSSFSLLQKYNAHNADFNIITEPDYWRFKFRGIWLP